MPGTPETMAGAVLDALDAKAPLAPWTDGDLSFDVAAAYRVSAALTRLRVARGEQVAGYKIGFTNRTIWEEYGVHAPIYGPVYATTLAQAAAASEIAVGRLSEPRIEPEIVFRFARTPDPAMDETALVSCLDSIAHGFEIVQSIHPGWRFRAPDTIACGALHGRLLVGPFLAMPGWRMGVEWRRLLERFTVTLARDGADIDVGRAENVLGGPLSALAHFIREAAADPDTALPGPGMIVSTGTLTRAFPVAPGERWTTRLDGLPLPGLDATITA